MRIICYVTSETASLGGRRYAVVMPGETVEDRPVSRHGDFDRWTSGRRETLAMMSNPAETETTRRKARAVARALAWIPRPTAW